jgi:hypothetical protein
VRRLALWKDADPDIPILKEAKAEYAKLQWLAVPGKMLPSLSQRIRCHALCNSPRLGGNLLSVRTGECVFPKGGSHEV